MYEFQNEELCNFFFIINDSIILCHEIFKLYFLCHRIILGPEQKLSLQISLWAKSPHTIVPPDISSTNKSFHYKRFRLIIQQE